MNYSKLDSIVLQFFLLILACITIFGVKEYIGPTVSGRLLWFTILSIVFFYVRKYKVTSVAKTYIVFITIGFVLHFITGNLQENETLNTTVIARIVPILLLLMAYQQGRSPVIFVRLMIIFYILECCISIYEKITLTHLISYTATEELAATSLTMIDSSVFRSFSLMFHPLFNANTVSIFLAFIFCSHRIKPFYKNAFIILGLLALWGFNSRGAMIIWGVILVYRLVLYKTKLLYVSIMLVVLYFAIPPLIEWVVYSGLFGRLTEMDFSDSSSLTRLEAFNVFFNERWNIQDIVVGGRVLCYPSTDLTLENGALLDLGFWGLIVGSIKIICEIVITYKAVEKYDVRDRILIMIAVWGVAFMNNNSFQTWPMTIFVLACVTFNDYMPFRQINFQNRRNESIIYYS